MSKHISTTDDDRKYYEQSAREEMAAYLHKRVWAPMALLAGLLDADENTSCSKHSADLQPLGNLIGLIANGIRVEIEIQANGNSYYSDAYRWLDAGDDMWIEWRKKDSEGGDNA